MKRNIPTIYDLASQTKISARRVMDFTNSANPLGPSAHARGAIRKSIKMVDRPVDDRARYLTRAIARLNDVPEENILTSGSFDGLFAAIIRSFNVKGLLACAPYPSYYRRAVEYPVSFSFLELDERDHFDLDLALWERALPQCDAAIVSHPSFISGKPLVRDDVPRMIARAEERGMLLIIDETLLNYSDTTSAAGDITSHPRCLVVSSMTEYYALEGLPVAYCIGDAATLRAIGQRFPVDPPSTLAAAAAAASLRDGEYPRRTRIYLASEREFIEERLRKIPGISFYTTACGSFVIQWEEPPPGIEKFSRYNILVDAISCSLVFPVKDHKWNARYLKTLKNIMGEHTNETL
jgi:threonine-phosphate decarboxylase